MPDKFGYIKNGYNPSEVDDYVNALENVIKSYKEKDSAIKNAIISAQMAADNIIKNAEIEAHQIKAKTVEGLKAISESLDKQKNLLKNFQNEYDVMVGKYLRNINESELVSIYSAVTEFEEYMLTLEKQFNSKEGE